MGMDKVENIVKNNSIDLILKMIGLEKVKCMLFSSIKTNNTQSTIHTIRIMAPHESLGKYLHPIN